jgi:hypothetical protein
VYTHALKSDEELEVPLHSFLTLALDRSEREFPLHIPLSSEKEPSVTTEKEAELVWMLREKKRFILVGNPTKIPQIFIPQFTQSLYSLNTLTRRCNKLDF